MAYTQIGNQLFASFKRRALTGEGIDLHVTGGSNAGIGVILLTNEDGTYVTQSNINSNAIENLADLLNTLGSSVTGPVGDATTLSDTIALLDSNYAYANNTLDVTPEGLNGVVSVDASGYAVFSSDSASPTFNSVTINNSPGVGETMQICQVILFQCGATAADCYPICMFDTGTGLPLNNPGGADVTVVWDTGAPKIFRW